jgi:hypothetical protein
VSVPAAISRQAASAAGMDTPDLRWRPVGNDVEGIPKLCVDAPAATLARSWRRGLLRGVVDPPQPKSLVAMEVTCRP